MLLRRQAPCSPRGILLVAAFLAPVGAPQSQDAPPAAPAPKPAPAPATAAARPWFEQFRIRGYGQIRYNRLFESNPQFQCEQCDRSWGDQGGFFIRRARLIVQGQIHPQLFIYLQPDFASSAGTTGHVAQLRDWYVDVGIDQRNAYRFRLGQSKVPYSYENMQSSSNRLPLDRADATNSANANERDLGAFFMYTPAKVRARLAELATGTGKGSGDYGMITLGAFNGQTANRPEANNNLHVVGRVSYPVALGTQRIEPGIAAYTGQYTITTDQRSTGVKGRSDWTYADERVIASLNVAPRPFGLLAEYNVGRGPEYNPARDSIETQSLHGGFVTVSVMLKRGKQVFFPFARHQTYQGGKKHERDARRYDVNDVEFGVEWQPSDRFELVSEWYRGDRRFEDKLRPRWEQRGHLLRIQAQFNY